ncbi:AAA family ATPase [Pseudolabrys taiwanensis]|uniref:AAA family ATPase n=1 Tax=Pseudolabrys taiwanensis TaxID=331696 RepID=A0A345ZZC8_9HYPH|nr:AAA family ATPase [Pseudolabrys taiwanensis]AXK82275.1 AAA family ATPase [Pseudolabrys taiwanensis]
MTTDPERYDKIYRPRTFSEVLGQDDIVRHLRSLIGRNKLRRNLLLCGDRGAGKTTLARLYAAALNCESNLPDGSACGTCETCRDPNGGGLFEYDTAGLNKEERESIGALLAQARISKCRGSVKVIFLDEAHALDDDAIDLLLKEIEDDRHGFVFCLATTAPAKLGEALISRLMVHRVRALAPDTALQLLRDIAAKQSIDYDPKALQLLAAVKRNYPRDLVIGLEQISGPGDRITVELVKEAFGVDQIDILHAYGLAFAKGQFDRASEILSAWQESPLRKAEWIRNYIVSLYYNVVLGRDVVVDPLLHGAIREQGAVVSELQQRLGLTAGRDLREHWESLLQFWARHRLDDDAGAQLTIALFERQIDILRDDSPLSASRSPIVPVAPPPMVEASSDAMGCTVIRSASEYMSAAEVREIINRASFFIQHHGKLFNVALTMRPFAASEPEAVEAIAAFRRKLAGVLSAKGEDGWGGAILIDRSEERGVHARFTGHVPGVAEQFRPEFEQFLGECRRRASDDGDCEIQSEVAPAGGKQALRFHWKAVLDLCASLYEPGLDSSFASTRRGILDRLGVRVKDRRDPRPISPPRLSFIGGLTDEALQEASRFNMTFLSAYDDSAFDRIRDGWELKEAADRRREFNDRQTKFASLSRQFTGDQLKQEQDVLLGKWPSDAKFRLRSWPVWWQQ